MSAFFMVRCARGALTICMCDLEAAAFGFTRGVAAPMTTLCIVEMSHLRRSRFVSDSCHCRGYLCMKEKRKRAFVLESSAICALYVAW